MSEGLFDRLRSLGADLSAMTEPKRNPRPPQLRGKRVDGTYYVRADDLAALLDAKGVLPNLAASLRKKDA